MPSERRGISFGLKLQAQGDVVVAPGRATAKLAAGRLKEASGKQR
jgi:hypothetical protein